MRNFMLVTTLTEVAGIIPVVTFDLARLIINVLFSLLYIAILRNNSISDTLIIFRNINSLHLEK